VASLCLGLAGLSVIPASRAAAAAAAGGAPVPATLTVDGAVALAIQSSPRLAAARERQRGRADSTSSLGRRMLPSVHVSEEFQIYDSPFSINFGAPITARDQVTNTFVASADQPVLGLLRLEQDRDAQVALTAAGDAQLAAAIADLRADIETQFLRFFEARAMKQIAEESQRELADQVQVAQARLASGVNTRADVLRIEVAAANAKQQSLQAESQALGARARIVAAIGLPAADAAALVLVEPHELLAVARAPARPFEAAMQETRLRRPELVAQRHLSLAADRQARARGFALLPEIDLEAAYTRIDGQIFAPANSAFVGVKAQWAIWEWGASLAQHRAAVAEASAARHDSEALERAIEADLENTLAQGDAARGAVEAAESAITSAEEAFRVTEVQVKAGTATTTDLLQAEASLTEARLNLTRAQYEMAQVAVLLRRATGQGS
jgi:outer membrane protein